MARLALVLEYFVPLKYFRCNSHRKFQLRIDWRVENVLVKGMKCLTLCVANSSVNHWTHFTKNQNLEDKKNFWISVNWNKVYRPDTYFPAWIRYSPWDCKIRDSIVQWPTSQDFLDLYLMWRRICQKWPRRLRPSNVSRLYWVNMAETVNWLLKAVLGRLTYTVIFGRVLSPFLSMCPS